MKKLSPFSHDKNSQNKTQINTHKMKEDKISSILKTHILNKRKKFDYKKHSKKEKII